MEGGKGWRWRRGGLRRRKGEDGVGGREGGWDYRWRREGRKEEGGREGEVTGGGGERKVGITGREEEEGNQ